ncbi:MAG: patatin-like phospholipase family protein [Thermoproteota archaeon]|nr:patatin-like phospholipase family protein [Thermoproteota archaeon]
MVQRALVLQGGGALGAYEVGVVKALVDNIINKNKQESGNDLNKDNDNRPLFDIVAGTSIGAVNAAIMVGNVIRLQKENPNLEQAEIWRGAVGEVERFWHEISDPLTMVPEWLRNTPLFENWLNNWKNINQFSGSLFSTWWNLVKSTREEWNRYYQYFAKEFQSLSKEEENNIIRYWNIPVFTEDWPYIKWISFSDNWKEEMPYIQSYFYWPENYVPTATIEALRRYSAVAASLIFGVPKALTPSIPQPDMKFFGPVFNRMDNTPLARTIKKYWDYEKLPIKTSFKDRQPRLFLVSVDALDATSPVAFDSYTKDKENGICKTVYGDEEYIHEIEYQDGIKMDHVMASMSVHLKHKYPKMNVKNNVGGGEGEEKVEERYFWDGAYLSNTPLREVLYGHRNYWRGVINEQVPLENGRTETIVPDMDVYIINLYPSIENELPMDADTIQDREIDIKFHDRTRYDVRLAEIATDYVEFIEQLESLALKHSEEDENFKRDYKALLDKVTRSKTRTANKLRTYRDLIEGRFDVHKVIYVERLDDGNTIFGKASEFTSITINQLKEAGYQDAQIALEIENLRDSMTNLVNNGIVTQQDADLLEQKLQTAITHAKHQDIDKAIVRLHELIIAATGTAKGKPSEGINWDILTPNSSAYMLGLAHLFGSARVLEVQLMISKLNVMINKGLLTQSQGDQLKQKLQTAKTVIKDQNGYNEIAQDNLQQFIRDLSSSSSKNIQDQSSQLLSAAKRVHEINAMNRP